MPNASSFEDALDQAQKSPDADRIFLGATTYTAPVATGFHYIGASPVEIIGQGAGQTVLTSQSGATSWVLRLVGGAGSSVHDLTIRLPENVSSDFTGLPTSNAARRIEVVEDQTQANRRVGVELVAGGTLEDSTVTLSSDPDTAAVRLVTPDVTVRRSTLSAWVGARSYAGAIEGSRVTGSDTGVLGRGGVTTITGSLIRASGRGVGIAAHPQVGSHTIVNADGVTVVGPGLPNTDGAFVGLEPAPDESADINLTNSIIRGFSFALHAGAAGASGQAKITASYSDYDPSGNGIEDEQHGSITEANVSNVGDAGFVDAANGDYHLLPGSRLIDAGDPATPQGLDLDGNPLIADGNGDGGARRDLGAFELQATPGVSTPPADTQAPLIAGFRATPSIFAVARASTPAAAGPPHGTRFGYTLSEPARVAVTIQRALAGRRSGGRCVRPSRRLRRAKRCIRYRTTGTLTRSGAIGSNRIRFTGRIARRALRPGRYRALIHATDQAANRSAPRATRFRVVRR